MDTEELRKRKVERKLYEQNRARKEKREADNWAIKRAIEILEANGIQLMVGACGRCSSPWVTMEYKGGVIVNDVYLDGAAFATSTFKTEVNY